jgi:hypothetical protein
MVPPKVTRPMRSLARNRYEFAHLATFRRKMNPYKPQIHEKLCRRNKPLLDFGLFGLSLQVRAIWRLVVQCMAGPNQYGQAV